DLLPEDRYEDWAAARREALRQTHLALLIDLARLQDGRGEHAAAIARLAEAIAREPAHEEAHTALMRALAATGRRAEALRQYARLREILRRDLDAEPEAASQALYAAILARRFPARGVVAGPVEPVPARARHNLPEPLTSFVGRRRE